MTFGPVAVILRCLLWKINDIFLVVASLQDALYRHHDIVSCKPDVNVAAVHAIIACLSCLCSYSSLVMVAFAISISPALTAFSS